MKHTAVYDIRVFLTVSGVFLALFFLILAEMFAFDQYKPSRLFNPPDQIEPVVASAQEKVKTYKTTSQKARVYFTTKSLMVGTCRATVPLEKTIYTDLNPIRDRLNALFEGPTDYEKSVGYHTSFEGWNQVFMGTVLQSDGTLLIRFNEEVLDKESDYYLGNFDNDCGRGVWEQIYLTAKEDERVKYVVFTINDDPSLWNKFITKRSCPPEKKEKESVDHFIQAEKQCAKPEKVEKEVEEGKDEE